MPPAPLPVEPATLPVEPAILPLVRRLRRRLEALYGARLAGVYLYGSHARGQATPESDVDVLVVLHGQVSAFEEIERMSGPVYDLELATGTVLSLLPVSARRYADADAPIYRAIHREGIAVSP